jgi:hypothetical protein
MYGIEDTKAELDDKIAFALKLVEHELRNALMKHRSMASPHEGHSVISEEMDELWEHVRADTGQTDKARKEAVQVAAMGLRYVIDLCR